MFITYLIISAYLFQYYLVDQPLYLPHCTTYLFTWCLDYHISAKETPS